METTFFNEELKLDSIQDTISSISRQLTIEAYSDEHNPLVERNLGETKDGKLNRAGQKKIDTVTLLTENILKNLVLKLDKEIIVEFYNRAYNNYGSYLKITQYLDHIGIIELYKAPSKIEFSKLIGREKSPHTIPTSPKGNQRKSSITATPKGINKYCHLYAQVAKVVRKKEEFSQDPTDFDSCIKLQQKNKEKDAVEEYTRYQITEEQKQSLDKRFKDLLAYRKEIPPYNATYFDSKLGYERPLNDMPLMVYSYREWHLFDRGGRITYLANRISTAYRPSIKFNGKDTVELDFKCSLPSILLGSAKRPEDFYDFTGFGKQYRSMFKLITVCILGARQESSVKRAMDKKLTDEWRKKENEQFWIDGKTEDEVRKDIKRCCERAIDAYKYYPDVEAKLFRGEDQISLELQYTESLIAWEIINYFVEHKKPIFCIHDSFIVLKEDKDLLHKKMIESYRKHVGVDPLPIDL